MVSSVDGLLTAGQHRSRVHLSDVIRIGCSGWNYRDWRGAFYPDGLPAHTPTPLHDGDSVHVGAWTTLTVYATA